MKKKKAKLIKGKRITIDQLAMMVQAGFGETATKADLERFVTKEDLLQFERRANAKYASKEDLKNLRFEFKEDLIDTEERIVLKLGGRIEKLENDMATVKSKLS